MNIIITSEHRVGSRWLHYLLADLYGMDVSPEMDAKKIYYVKNREEVRKRFDENKIVKFHHALPDKIIKYIEPLDYKIIGVVRNPRDRAVSFAFHNRYHKSNYPFKAKEFDTDFEAVKYTVKDDDAFKKNSKRQFELMEKGFSTRNWTSIGDDNPFDNYIWTTYEWMKEDTLREISKIVEFLGPALPEKHIQRVVNRNSFKAKTGGREAGTEMRTSLWRRKGVVGDYLNWFDEEMMYLTENEYEKYWEIVNNEEKMQGKS